MLWTGKPTAGEHGRLLDQIQKWGFDGVEFPVIAMEAADIREMGKRCDGLGLKRSALLAYAAADADPVSPDPKLRRAAVDLIRRSIDKTRDIGADILAGPIQQGLGRFTGSGPSKEEWSRSVEVIRKAGQHAAGMHVKLAFEPLNRFEMFLMNTISEAARFAAEVALRPCLPLSGRILPSQLVGHFLSVPEPTLLLKLAPRLILNGSIRNLDWTFCLRCRPWPGSQGRCGPRSVARSLHMRLRSFAPTLPAAAVPFSMSRVRRHRPAGYGRFDCGCWFPGPWCALSSCGPAWPCSPVPVPPCADASGRPLPGPRRAYCRPRRSR